MHPLLSPIVDALAPPDGARALRRTRNAAAWLAVLALLAPQDAALATGATDRKNLLAGVFVVVGVAAHFLQKRASGPWIVAGATVALGVAATVVTGAPWGVALGAVLAAFLAAAALRQRAGHHAAGRAVDLRPATPGRFAGGVAMGFVKMMIFTTFATMPIHVPTDSMKPTILGAPLSGPPAALWRDPIAWVEAVMNSQDFLLVDRAVYMRRDPRRWEIAVFEFPLQRSTNFVKRIVGLPDETVEIRGGDIWVNGKIARKPALVQESLWRGVFPRSAATAAAQDLARAFAPEDLRASGGWSRDGDGVRGTVKSETPSWYGYTRKLESPDARIGARLTIEKGAAAHLRIVSRGTPIVLTMRAPGDGPCTLTVGVDTPVTLTRGAAAGQRVELSTAEGLVRVTVDGAEVAAAETSCEGPSKNTCALGVSGGKASFHGIRVERDVFYVSQGTTKWIVPPGKYVVLGDNSEASEDSRLWTVTELDVRGAEKPVRAATAVLTETGGRKDNVTQKGDLVSLTDVDGVPRSIPRDDITSRRTGVAASFVPRDHILGRVILIYWPVLPRSDGGFRPRILP